jgi:hypothetical protein
MTWRLLRGELTGENPDPQTLYFGPSAQPLTRRFATLPRRSHAAFQTSPLRTPCPEGEHCPAGELSRRQMLCCVVGARTLCGGMPWRAPLLAADHAAAALRPRAPKTRTGRA